MSEISGAEILIGGRIPTNVVPKLCAAISSEEISLDWVEASFHPDTAFDLLANRIEYEDAQVLRLCNVHALWGRFEQLEAFLQQHGIPFDRFSEGKWEFDPEWVAFRPGDEPVAIPTNSNWEPVVAASVPRGALVKLAGAINDLDQGGVQQALAAMRAVRETLSSELPKIPAPLESLEIEPISSLAPKVPPTGPLNLFVD